jgi:hypothetical protein
VQNAIAKQLAFCYCLRMDAKTYISKYGRDSAKQVAESAQTTIEYFNQIASGHRRPSVSLAERLVVASKNELDFVSLLTVKSTQHQSKSAEAACHE